MPNFDSPRVRAAMRVLGVVRRDLENKGVEAFESEVRWEFFEKKRRAIINSVMALHDESPEGQAAPDGIAKAKQAEEALMAQVTANEKKAVEVMNRISRKEIQKTMIKELEEQHQAVVSKEKQQEAKKRQEVLIKERNKKLAEQKKEAAKKLERSIAVKEKAEREAKQEAEKLGEELEKKAAAVDVKLKQIADGRIDGRIAKQEKRAAAWERKEKHDASFIASKEKLYDTLLARDKVVDGRLEAINSITLNNSAIFAEQLAGCVKRAAEQIEKNQDIREENHVKAMERSDKAEVNRKQELAKATKEYRDRNAKEKKGHEGRYERIKKGLEEGVKPSKSLIKAQSMGDFSFQGCMSRPEYHFQRESHNSLISLGEFNREMLRRSHEYNQTQELARINGMRQRANAIIASRIKVGQRRMEMIKNCAAAKHDLSMKVTRARSAAPGKMIQIVADMEPDQEATTKINELLSAMKMDLLPGTNVADGDDGK